MDCFHGLKLITEKITINIILIYRMVKTFIKIVLFFITKLNAKDKLNLNKIYNKFNLYN
jgi:hypothetical protein